MRIRHRMYQVREAARGSGGAHEGWLGIGQYEIGAGFILRYPLTMTHVGAFPGSPAGGRAGGEGRRSKATKPSRVM